MILSFISENKFTNCERWEKNMFVTTTHETICDHLLYRCSTVVVKPLNFTENRKGNHEWAIKKHEQPWTSDTEGRLTKQKTKAIK
jgi:hypothetical protein